MARRYPRWFLSTLIGLLFATATVATAAAQQAGTGSSGQGPAGSRSLVVLTSLQAPSSDAVARKLASTITGSLELMMKLSGDVTVRRADFLAPTLSFERETVNLTKSSSSTSLYFGYVGNG